MEKSTEIRDMKAPKPYRLALAAVLLVIVSAGTTRGAGPWKTSGNAGTNPAVDFLGTTDGQNLAVQPGLGSVLVGVTFPFADEKLRVFAGAGVPATGPGLGTALFAEAANNIAIFGNSAAGNGVFGISGSSAGTVGHSLNGTGVIAISRRTDGGDVLRAQHESPPSTFQTVFRVDTGGNVFATSYNVVSTRTRKENVAPIDDALRKVRELQGVQFTWKPEYGGKRDIGLIAEDVGKVFPELVTWERDGTARSLNYDHLVAVIVEAIKAQQKQLDQLNVENASLRRKLTSLEMQIAERMARQAAANAQ